MVNNMKKLTSGLITQKYTFIEHEEHPKFNAPHHFKVKNVENGNIVGEIDFQEGPIKENGVNGVNNEDLIAMVIARLKGFQNGEYSCRENAIAITKLEECLMWLRKRTNDRIARNVEGTSSI